MCGEAEKFAEDDGGDGAERFARECDGRRCCGGGAEQAAGACGDEVGDVGLEVGGAGDAGLVARREAGEARHDGGSQGGAEAGAIVVGRVVTRLHTGGTTEREGVGPGEAEHGAKERDAGRDWARRAKDGQASRATAAQETHEEGLGEIIGVVGGGDEGAGVRAGEGGERGVAGAAGVGFGVAGRSANGDGGMDEGEAVRGGELLHESKIGLCVACGAHVVENVRDDDVVGACGEGEKKGRGIGPARAGNEGPTVRIADGRTAGEGPPGSEDGPFQGVGTKVGGGGRHVPIIRDSHALHRGTTAARARRSVGVARWGNDAGHGIGGRRDCVAGVCVESPRDEASGVAAKRGGTGR